MATPGALVLDPVPPCRTCGPSWTLSADLDARGADPNLIGTFQPFSFLFFFPLFPSFSCISSNIIFCVRAASPERCWKEKGCQVPGKMWGVGGDPELPSSNYWKVCPHPPSAQQVSPTCASLIASRPQPCVVTRNSNTRTLFK